MSTNFDTKIANEPHPAEVIADYIEEHGWTQGIWTDEDGACCISGAGRIVFGKADFYSKIYGLVEQRLKLGGGPLDLGLAAWNDQPGRTKEEVLKALRGQQ